MFFLFFVFNHILINHCFVFPTLTSLPLKETEKQQQRPGAAALPRPALPPTHHANLTARQRRAGRSVFPPFTQDETANGLCTPSSRHPVTFCRQDFPGSGGSRDRRRPVAAARSAPVLGFSRELSPRSRCLQSDCAVGGGGGDLFPVKHPSFSRFWDTSALRADFVFSRAAVISSHKALKFKDPKDWTCHVMSHGSEILAWQNPTQLCIQV